MPPPYRNSKPTATVALVTILAHLIFIAVLVLVLVWLLHLREGISFKFEGDGSKLFNLHPFFMIIGLVLIAGQAIMAYKTVPAERKTQKGVHMLLQLVALIFGIMGIITVFKFKGDAGGQHMISLHSWFGIIVISLFGLQWLLAFFSFIFPGTTSFARASYMPWHIFGGMVIFLLTICTVQMGLMERFIWLGLSLNQEGLIVNFIGLLIFLFAVAVGLTVTLPAGY
ncbi:hypothetical protein ACFE04_019989 [Oxalis oulophora]